MSQAVPGSSSYQMKRRLLRFPNLTQAKGTLKEFLELISSPAVTSIERFRILDSRDKLLRSRITKGKQKLDDATTCVGTCDDMCPEKERYFREFHSQVKEFEYAPDNEDGELNGTDHRFFIKEYVSSSAGQEEPLPHELRPILTLQRTMDYLLQTIIPKMENDDMHHVSDSYTFMWDRTRAVRKDMTRQQLVCVDAIAIIEKCTRFHIFSSVKLFGTNTNLFDSKLNDDNLMNCFKTLEGMYQINSDSVNEAEFRSYHLLMCLKHPDVFRHLTSKMHQGILNSSSVTMSIQIFETLQALDYTAFFKLCESSTFMALCILHRYLVQIRTKALKRLLEMKNWHNIPTMKIQECLGFGHGDEIYEEHFKPFSNLLFLAVSNTTQNAMSAQSSSLQSARNYIVRHANLTVTSKMQMTLTEEINGGPTRRTLDLSLHSSFDDAGHFRKELLEVLLTQNQSKPQQQATESITPNPSSLTAAKQIPTQTPSKVFAAEESINLPPPATPAPSTIQFIQTPPPSAVPLAKKSRNPHCSSSLSLDDPCARKSTHLLSMSSRLKPTSEPTPDALSTPPGNDGMSESFESGIDLEDARKLKRKLDKVTGELDKERKRRREVEKIQKGKEKELEEKKKKMDILLNEATVEKGEARQDRREAALWKKEAKEEAERILLEAKKEASILLEEAAMMRQEAATMREDALKLLDNAVNAENEAKKTKESAAKGLEEAINDGTSIAEPVPTSPATLEESLDNGMEAAGEGEVKEVVLTEKRKAGRKGSKKKTPRNVPKSPAGKAVTWEHCGIQFTTRSNWTRHMHLHDADLKVFKCPQCDSSYSRSEKLKRHMRIHHA